MSTVNTVNFLRILPSSGTARGNLSHEACFAYNLNSTNEDGARTCWQEEKSRDRWHRRLAGVFEARVVGKKPSKNAQTDDEGTAPELIALGLRIIRAQAAKTMRSGSAGKKKRAKTGGTGLPRVFQRGVSPVASELQVTRRNLPHWQLGGASYFVTFRMKQGRLSEQERSLVLAACLHWHQRKWRVYAVVVMPDHVHLLVQPLPRGKNKWHALGAILHSVKSYAAHQIQKRRKRVGSIWLDESFDRIVRNDAEFREKLLYMAHNPIKAGLASREGEYSYFWCG